MDKLTYSDVALRAGESGTALPTPDFSLPANASSVSATRGASGTYPFVLASGQSLSPANNRSFAVQMSGNAPRIPPVAIHTR